MKIAADIKELIEADVKKLTELFLTGEISLPKEDPSSPSYESQVQNFASEIIRLQIEGRMAEAILPYLSTMKWFTLIEACIYMRKSKNTVLNLIKEGQIYGTKAEGGEWIVDRETCDAYYNEERVKRQEKLKSIRRAS